MFAYMYLQTCSQPELRNFIGLNLAIVYIRSGVGGSRSIEVHVHTIKAEVMSSSFLVLITELKKTFPERVGLL